MEPPTILVTLGALFLLAGIVGGGLTLKELTLPALNRCSRILASVVGFGLIIAGVYIQRRDHELKTPVPAPAAQTVPPKQQENTEQTGTEASPRENASQAGQEGTSEPAAQLAKKKRRPARQRPAGQEEGEEPSSHSSPPFYVTPAPDEPEAPPEPERHPKAVVQGNYPEGSLRYLNEADMEGKSNWELRVMRNEIFARHGYIFKTDMKNYFNRQWWYSPRSHNVDSELTEIEKRNVDFIKKHE